MTSPKNPTKYKGTDVYLANVVTRNRQPTGADYRQPETGRLYPVFAQWQVGKNPVNGVEGELWLLTKIVANVAFWELINGSGTGTVVSLTGDDTVVVSPDVSGNINLFGETVANATNAKPVFTTSLADNTENIEVQLATTVAPTPVSNVNVGLACFNATQFQIDTTSGMVSLHGSTVNPPVLSTTGDDGVAVVPSAAGNLNLFGNVVANSTHAKPLFVVNSASNTERFDIQLAAVVAPTPGNPNKAGIACFNNMQFAIDSVSGMVSAIGSLTDLHVARYIVSAGGTTDGANFTTIAAAYASAVAAGAPQTVSVQPGTYPEDLTLTAGINLTAFSCDALTPNVTILGNVSSSDAGHRSISGINLQTNADFAVSVTGSAATVVDIINCKIFAQNNNAIQFTSSSGSSRINFRECLGDIGGTNAYFTHSGAGLLQFFGGIYGNNSASTTASTVSGSGAFNLKNAFMNNAFTTSGTAFAIMTNSEHHGAIIHNGTGASDFTISCSSIDGGTASALSIGAGATAVLSTVSVSSTNTNAITGTGTLESGNLSFNNSSSLINTTTQILLQGSNTATVVKIPGAYPYTIKPQDYSIPVNTGSARTINLPAAPTTGEAHIIFDDTGTAGTNTITLQGNGNNINGASSKTITTNFGSILAIFNGTQWNAK